MKDTLVASIEDLAAQAVILDVALADEIALFKGALAQIKADASAGGVAFVADACSILESFLASRTLSPKSWLEIFSVWILVLRSVISGETKPGTGSVLEKMKLQMEQLVSGAAKPPDLFDPVPKIPAIDLSEGSELLLEFITESMEHLDGAEQALLELKQGQFSGEAVNTVFREFHTIKGSASFLNFEDIRLLAHETETMMDFVRQGILVLSEDVIQGVLEAIDGLRKLLELLREQALNKGVLKSPYFDIGPAVKKIHSIVQNTSKRQSVGIKLGEILAEKEIISQMDLAEALQLQDKAQGSRRLGDILVEMGAATREQIDRGLKEQKQVVAEANAIRISTKKVDDLADMVGELVIPGTQVVHHPEVEKMDSIRLKKDLAQLDKIIRDIQGISMSMRLVPIKPIFQKMVRLVRDLTQKMNKKVDIRLTGEGTEIDKNIIDLISDPLMHMVRNSVDHGIEPVETRRQRGKPDIGWVGLNAYHKGGQIVIEVTDDGGGLDREKILSRAVERGLAAPDEALSEEAINLFIFQPGFSTAEKVTDISGRGVGMDVVKRNIENLQGHVEVKSSFGSGTTFLLKLPLTVAIIEGIIIRVGNERYIIPISAVSEFISIHPKDVTDLVGKKQIVKVHDKMYPLVRLDEHLGTSYEHTELTSLSGCLVQADRGMLCLLIDELIGQQQVVIKKMGHYLSNVPGVMGVTILGDGRVGLILDVNGIAGLAKTG
jgi:two-component system chemotaxis sensor kinase CheA